MPMSDEEEIKRLTQRLLVAIANADWDVYEELCDPSLSCFEPEAPGQLIEGLEFHKFYFQLGPARDGHNTTLSSPHIRVVGDIAVISYVRLNQRISETGEPTASAVAETRVWQRKDNRWRHIHFHRSGVALC